MLVGKYFEHLKRRGLARGTIEKRRLRLREVERRIGLTSATPEGIEELLDGRKLSAKTRYDWISDLHQFYRWAIDWGHLESDPTVRLMRPKLPRYLPRPISTSDLTVALEMAEPTMRTWLCLASFAGLRCVEIAGLEIDSVLWDARLLRVIGKGDKERLVPMHPEVERMLRMTRMPSRGKVFRRPRGGGYTPVQVSREISLYFESLNIEATAHMLRHWFGTHAYRVSRDLRVVQELMGHSSPTTTSIYAEWSKHEAQRTVDALRLETAPSLFSEWSG